MDQVHVVRHKVLVEGQGVRRVAREMGLARNTARKYLEVAAPVRAWRKLCARCGTRRARGSRRCSRSRPRRTRELSARGHSARLALPRLRLTLLGAMTRNAGHQDVLIEPLGLATVPFEEMYYVRADVDTRLDVLDDGGCHDAVGAGSGPRVIFVPPHGYSMTVPP